jgi:hypothetical protein
MSVSPSLLLRGSWLSCFLGEDLAKVRVGHNPTAILSMGAMG